MHGMSKSYSRYFKIFEFSKVVRQQLRWGGIPCNS